MNILIVDDEPGLAAGLAGWLEENGWGALGVATTSDEAVEWINRNGRVDVLVCDVAIEPADGFTLRETIQPHLPKMQTIFISGYDLTEYAARMAGCRFLQKPVSGEALDGAIRSLFETVPDPAPAPLSTRRGPTSQAPRPERRAGPAGAHGSRRHDSLCGPRQRTGCPRGCSAVQRRRA